MFIYLEVGFFGLDSVEVLIFVPIEVLYDLVPLHPPFTHDKPALTLGSVGQVGAEPVGRVVKQPRPRHIDVGSFVTSLHLI
jgi:hypothetical protein